MQIRNTSALKDLGHQVGVNDLSELLQVVVGFDFRMDIYIFVGGAQIESEKTSPFLLGLAVWATISRITQHP